ncbi:MAG: Rnf-Nqr domain containing protein, partial [Pseudomonadales bacterium]
MNNNTLQGLWSNNPALVQLLGLCPLLAVSNTVANSLVLG